MTITVNGETRQVPEPLDVRGLLEHLEVRGSSVAFELNRQVIPRSDWEQTPIREGDRVEIVHFVGGG